MNYERFSQLWDALVVNRPKTSTAESLSNGMTKETADALIEYGQGKKDKVNKVREFLANKSKD